MNLKLGYKNSRRSLKLMTTGLFLTLAILLGFAIPAVAADQHDFVFPAGEACKFELGIDFGDEGHQVTKDYVDKNGTVVRTLSAGTGNELVFTNVVTGATFSTKSNGAVGQTIYNPDGSQRVTVMGHYIIILFPTDVPAGPSTTLYVGRVVYTVNTSEVFTLQQPVKAQATDICAALSK